MSDEIIDDYVMREVYRFFKRYRRLNPKAWLNVAKVCRSIQDGGTDHP